MYQFLVKKLEKKYSIKTPGDEIKKQILAKGLTPEQVNEDLKWEPDTVTNLLTADIPLTAEHINSLQKYLGLHKDHFEKVGNEYIKELMAALKKEHGL